MPLQNRILDNQANTVADHLRRDLPGADSFSLVSAYFTIYGYELLEEALAKVGNVRFLFGDPASVEDLDPGNIEPKSFELTEDGLVPNHALHQKYLAQRCTAWVSRDAVAIRSVSQSNFLHGKLYLTASGQAARTAVVGSSNFTKRGLGGSEQSNLEINLATEDAATVAELQEWFDLLWNNEKRTDDVKQKVLDALGRIGNDHPPEAVYYKTLYELFRKDIEARLAGDDSLVATGVHGQPDLERPLRVPERRGQERHRQVAGAQRLHPGRQRGLGQNVYGAGGGQVLRAAQRASARAVPA